MRRRRGVTLIELLVVIAIIGILGSLLLPAILQSRSAGRKAQCAANLKQLAQAVQTFHHRNECLPVYWGPMKASAGQKFGGWLLHLLPDMEQTAYYDMVPASTTTGSMYVVVSSSTWATGKILPAIPASPDYYPGDWTEVTIGTAFVNGVSKTITEWQLVGRVGDPGCAARPETMTREVYGWVPSTDMRLAAEYLPVARQMTLPCLTDADDPGMVESQAIPVTTATNSLDNMQLTNYMANVHVFTKFNGARMTTGTMAGAFPSPVYQDANNRNFYGWHHGIASTTGPVGRSFTHVQQADGLSNTILFGEGMRQCDNLAQYRAAMFPTGNPMNEHGFGIECQWRKEDGTLFATNQAYGNTLMFQTLPDVKMANPLRLQAMHGAYLMVAMCDGSIRAISSTVSRREPIAVNACGRENFGSKFYDPSSRGANLPDGVWDMLMVPNDPPGNVLANTGEIGREK